MSFRQRSNAWLKACRNQLAFWRAIAAHEQTPRSARWLIVFALAYLLWPVDLIPDWIPGLGQLDDLLLVGLALWIAWRLTPETVRMQCRDEQTV